MGNKKLLIVGSNALWAIENIYARHLNGLGLQTSIFNCSSFIERSLNTRVFIRLGFNHVYKQVNTELIRVCLVEKPDIVWIFKGVEIFPETLHKLKTLGIYLANYNPDHPFIRTFTSSGGKNIPESVPLYDKHFCYSRALVTQIETEYQISSEWLPFGFELSEQQYQQALAEPEVLRACFLGNPDKKRASIIQMVAKEGIPIDVYGHGWQKWLKPSRNLGIYDGIYQDEFWKTLRKYRVQLNIFREHNEGSHNMRTFEVPAVGGVMLAPESEEHQYFFQKETECFLYYNQQDLMNQIEKILQLNKVQNMRDIARKKSINFNYSYYYRALDVMKSFRII
ncbi:MAG: glycosyltransferase family 1 protein [Chitinophagales bacterium]|nr:glycosyltransferase family 1 protein [Chitinophagales bacterium]